MYTHFLVIKSTIGINTNTFTAHKTFSLAQIYVNNHYAHLKLYVKVYNKIHNHCKYILIIKIINFFKNLIFIAFV